MPRPFAGPTARLVQTVGWPLVALLAAARIGTFRRPWLLDLLDIWAAYLLAPWPLLWLVAALTRSRSLAGLAAVGSALAIASGRASLARGPGPGNDVAVRLRVLSANVLGRNLSAAALADLIERERPDVVALQEVRLNFCAELIERVGPLLPYFETQPHERFSGAALLSRLPLHDVENFRLTTRGHLCQRAQLHLDEQRVHLFNVHLETPFELFPRASDVLSFGIRRRALATRDEEVDRLICLASGLSEPVLLVGDFNASAGSRPHRQLRRYFRDVFLEVGHGLGHTFPRPVSVYGPRLPAPVLRIDYAFARGPLEPISARTLDHPGSDHRALLVELGFA